MFLSINTSLCRLDKSYVLYYLIVHGNTRVYNTFQYGIVNLDTLIKFTFDLCVLKVLRFLRWLTCKHSVKNRTQMVENKNRNRIMGVYNSNEYNFYIVYSKYYIHLNNLDSEIC